MIKQKFHQVNFKWKEATNFIYFMFFLPGESISIRIKIAVHRIRSTYRVNCSDAPGDAPLGIFRLCWADINIDCFFRLVESKEWYR